MMKRPVRNPRIVSSNHIYNRYVINLYAKSIHDHVANPSLMPKTPMLVDFKIWFLNFKSKCATMQAKLKEYGRQQLLFVQLGIKYKS